ncbi:MAG TPA: hypothetical protein VH593_24215 [Ktedonobacteraceae bacterium]|jgi:hypothetical protein
MLPERAELERDLKHALQEVSLHRSLDSLDTIIVRSYLASKGIEVPDNSLPHTNTIGGWLEWAEQFSLDG